MDESGDCEEGGQYKKDRQKWKNTIKSLMENKTKNYLGKTKAMTIKWVMNM